MRIFNSFQLPLAVLVFTIIIQISWTAVKSKEDLLHDIIRNPRNAQSWNNPAAAASHATASVFTQNANQYNAGIADLIAENVLHFGHNLGLQLSALDPYASNSEIFSPLSVMSALSFLMLGAKGKSYQELKQLIGLDFDSELSTYPSKFHEEFGLMLNDLQHLNVNRGTFNRRQNANWRNKNSKSAPIRSSGHTEAAVDHIIKVANGIFVQSGYTLNPHYSQVIKSIYNSELTTLDFQFRSRDAKDYINAWVNRSTFGKIPHIIKGEIEKSTNVILASVLYFKGFWENSFFPRSTTEDNFYPDGLKSAPVKVQMMATGGIFPFYDAKEYDCRIIGLPYKGNETTMYVIQPNNSTRQRLRDLQQVLNGRKINQMIDNMERKTTVMVFPKMHFTRIMNMKTMLQNLGIRDIFLNGYSDLSLIGGRQAINYQGTPARLAPANSGVSFASIQRNPPTQQNLQFVDRYDEPALVFTSRFGEIDEPVTNKENSTITTTETPETTMNASQFRDKRSDPNLYHDPTSEALAQLESNRLKHDSYPSNLFVDEIIHKVDFAVDEQGTEAAAATLTYLHRSGTDVVFRGDTPFLIVIRHDPTKLPLFYAIINKPEL